MEDPSTADVRPRVLIADDDEINVAILSEALGSRYRVATASDGDEALRIARTAPHPDLILMDVMMPGKNGFAVCRELKASAATLTIPVIFVTSMNDAANEEVGFSAGAADYIAKPISPAIVRARVEVHLRLKLQNEFLERVVLQRSEDLEAVRRQARALLREYSEALEGKLR